MRRGKQSKKPKPVLVIDEILKNAVSSIQLGVEDFILSRDVEGKEARAISAVRNLYSGVLLLFKYKIASLAATPDQARDLIFIPGSILPEINETGAIVWVPSPSTSNNTISTLQIEARLKSLNIYHDWVAIQTLRNCRNALEHLHPTDSTSAIQASIAALFPMLGKFISKELGEHPAALLGDAWTTMLATHELIRDAEVAIKSAWEAIEYPAQALEFLATCTCPACTSSLLQPAHDDVANEVPIDTTDFQYECFACHQHGSLLELLQNDFSLIHEDPFDEHDESVDECGACNVRMCLLSERKCYWCGHQTVVNRCERCRSALTDFVAYEGGTLCNRCSEDDWHFPTFRNMNPSCGPSIEGNLIAARIR